MASISSMVIPCAFDTLEIRESSPQEAVLECQSILNATRRHESDSRRFHWLYRDNPDGEATVWTAHQGSTGTPVGFVAALPRRMLVQGAVRRCWNGADASVLADYRGQGVATRLRAATRAAIDEGRADFFYAHPNERMAGAHARAGNRPLGTMVRVARPLRFGPYAAEFLSSRRIGAIVGRVIDPVLRRMGAVEPTPTDFRVAHVLQPTFDERFDGLFWREVVSGPSVVGVRDARYLNWRYAQNPLHPTRLITVETEECLAGYLLYTEGEDAAHINDIFPMHRTEIVRVLLAEVLRSGDQAGWKSVGMTLLESNPLLAVLKGLGFRRRQETSQMFAYCPDDRPWAGAVYDKQGWWLTVGDRDV
jgi:GNAT superfamily N-acetyltransferase